MAPYPEEVNAALPPLRSRETLATLSIATTNHTLSIT